MKRATTPTPQDVERDQVFRSSPFQFLETSPHEQGIVKASVVHVVAKGVRLSPQVISTKIDS